MTNLTIREWLNGGLIPLNVCIIIIILHSLWEASRKYGPGWATQPGIASACALLWIFTADLIRSAVAWSLLHDQGRSQPLQYLSSNTTMLYIIAGTMASCATFRLIYTLSPSRWGHWGWVSAAILTTIFMTGIILID